MPHGVRPLLVLPLALSLAACGPIDRATDAPPRPIEPGSREEATVTRVVDGDTIHVLLYGPEASHSATARLTGGLVELEFDRDLIDLYERTLAYVWLDGRLFNETLVRRGFAEAKAYPPNVAQQDELDAAESRARADHRGVWRAC